MAGYTRQSSFVDGDTITAALFNDEYNQLVNVFSNTSGHKHDGTAAEGPVIGLIGDAGETSPNNKVLIDTTNNYIEFYVEVSSAPVQQLYIADGAIVPVTDSDIDLGTTSLRFKDIYTDTVTTTGNVTVGGNLTVTGNATISGNLTFGDADTDSITLTADVASHITPDVDDTYDLGTSTKQWRNLYIDGTAEIDTLALDGTTVTSTAAELNILDGVTSTAAELNLLDGVTSTTAELNILDGVTSTATELNIVDGDTAATSTTLADADRVVVNDNGTMVQVALTDFETYFESALDTLSNVTTVGALNSGSITSGFGSIDNGSSAITTTGTITYGSLSDGTITITAFVDEDDMTSNSATLVPTQQSVKAYVDAQVTAQDLDFQGDTGGALSIDLDSETLTIAGGTGIDTVGATNTLTVSIDSTVATLTGTQTLTNKTLTTPVISSISNTGTLTLPTSTDTLVGRATTDTLTNKTLTSPVINTGVSGTAVLDDDTFATASATTLATSESIKAYVDTQITAEDLDVSDGTTSIAIDLDSETLGILGGTGLTSSASGNNVTLSVDASQTQITAVGTLTDLTVTGEITANGGIALGDSDQATFGDSDDLLIYHSGTNSFIKDTGQGSLYIDATNLYLRSATNENFIYCNADGKVSIYHDDSLKLTTESTGINVTGTVVADGLDIDGDTTLEGTTSTDATTAATAVSEAILRVKPHADTGNSLWFSLANSADPVLQSSNFDGTTLNDILLNPFGGNVGIGTTSPSTILGGNSLEISNATGSEVIVFRDDGSAAADDFCGGFVIGNKDASGTPNHYAGMWADTDTLGQMTLQFAGGRDKYEAGTADMVIDVSGNIGIGTSSPAKKLEISDTSVQDVVMRVTNNDGNAEFQKYQDDLYLNLNDSGNIIVRSGTSITERMRIDSSGNVMVGKTAVGVGTAGIELRANNMAAVSRASDNVLYLNRITDDGSILEFRKDNVVVGNIGAATGTTYIDGGSTYAGLQFGGDGGSEGRVVPRRNGSLADGQTTLGTSSYRFKELYLSGVAKVDSSAYISQQALTSSSGSVAWDAAAKANAYYATTENTTFAAPTNAVEGAIISVEIAQGATAYTVAWNTVFEFAASTAPTVTATANKTDIFSFRYNGSVWQEIGRTQNLAQT